MTVTTTPRVREDLQATPTEDAGIWYFDVNDPRSGSSMRMYDYEWLIAREMDGKKSFNDLARWAGEQFEWSPSTDDLAAYAHQLQTLGFLDEEGADAAAQQAAQQAALHGANVETTLRTGPPAQVIEMEAPMSREMHVREISPPQRPPQRSVEIEDEGQPEIEVTTEETDRTEPGRELEGPAPWITPSLSPSESLPVAAAGETSLPPPPQIAVVAEPAVELSPSMVTTLPESPEPAPLPPQPPGRETRGEVREFRPPPVQGEREIRPVREAVMEPRTDVRPERPSRTLTWVLVALLLLAGLGALYAYVIQPMLAPMTVQTMKVGAPATIVNVWDKAATVMRSEPTTVTSPQDGKLVEVIAAGAEVKPGTVLARFDGAADIDKQLTEVRERLRYYEGKADEAKIAEKKRMIADLEAKQKTIQVVATTSGTVAEAIAKVEAEVKAGEPLVKLVENQRMTTEFQLPPSAASSLKAGELVRLRGPGAAMGGGKVVSVGSAEVKVEITDDAGGRIKAGDTVEMIKGEVPNVMTIPAKAVTKGAAGDMVYVNESGVARARSVTVVDRTASDALVTTGIKPGDEILTMYPAELQDGQKIQSGNAGK